MKLPMLAADTANHVAYGAAIALAATLGAVALGQPAAAFAFGAVLLFAVGKEAADYASARRALREGSRPTHSVEWPDLFGTLSGGLAVILARIGRGPPPSRPSRSCPSCNGRPPTSTRWAGPHWSS